MKEKIALIIFIMLIASVTVLFAAEPTVILNYFEGGVYIDTPRGEHFEGAEISEGYIVPVGSTISTEQDGYVELLVSDSSIIKLDANTTFSIAKLKGVSGSPMNVFDMTYGKFTAVINKMVSSENTYEFNGNASVCGVRGTGLSMWIRTNDKSGKEEESAYTIDGDVEYWKKSAPDKKIRLLKGKYANAFDDVLKPIDIPNSMLDDFNKTIAFNPRGVATPLADEGGTPEPTKAPDSSTGESTPTPEPGKEGKEDNGNATGGNGNKGGSSSKGGGGIVTEPDGAKSAEMPEWLSKLLGLEIGSITIGETTYAKAVLQPSFTIDKLSMALYLPIIYQKNLFDPGYWYKPDGNSEWSFGSDYFGRSDWAGGAGDIVSDLFLKIKYVQWGDQRDPFFIKLGNINNFTIGHGLLMRNYANDSEFPAVRKVGFNLGVDMVNFGFELMSNDLSKIASSPRIAGLRLYARPAAPSFPLALGVSAVADFNPAEGMNMTVPVATADMIGNPMFFNLAVDLDLPIVNTDPFSVIGFADFGGMMPYLRTQGASPALTPGLHTETMFTGSEFKNYGFATGFLGNITMFTYQLEFRYMTGTFKHGFYGPAYDTVSNDLAFQTADYIVNPTSDKYDNTTLGIYFEGGMKIDKLFSLSVGYMLPMTLDSSGFKFGEGEDIFHAEFVLEPDIIPVVNLSGSIAYDRSYFVSMITGKKSLTGKTLDFFDEYSVLSGQIVYGISKSMDLAFILSTAVAKDSTGAIMYESDGMTKKIDVTWGIETRIHF